MTRDEFVQKAISSGLDDNSIRSAMADRRQSIGAFDDDTSTPSPIPSPEEQARLTHSTPVPNSEFAPEWKKNVSAIARPVLETGGMVGGGLLAGAGATPETLGLGTIPAAIAGSTLGYAGGKGIADALDTALGLREGKSLGEAGQDIVTGAEQAMLGPVIGKSIPMVAKGIGKAIAAPLGTTTGAGTGAVEEAFKNNSGFRQGLSGEVTEQGLVKTLYNRLSDMAEKRAEDYAASLRNLQVKTPVDFSKAENTLLNRLKTFGMTVKKDIPSDVMPVWDAIDKETQAAIMKNIPNTVLTQGSRGLASKDIAKSAMSIFDDFRSVGDYTPYGVDTLRMNLRELSGSSPQANAMLKPVLRDLVESVESVSPGYKTMLDRYSTQSKQLSNLKKILSITDEGGNTDTTGRKLMTIFRDINKNRLDKLDELDPDGTLKAQVAGLVMKSGMPRGQLTRLMNLGGAGLIAAATQNPAAVFGLATISSPRIVGETANLAGKAYKQIPDGMTDAFIRALILRNTQ